MCPSLEILQRATFDAPEHCDQVFLLSLFGHCPNLTIIRLFIFEGSSVHWKALVQKRVVVFAATWFGVPLYFITTSSFPWIWRIDAPFACLQGVIPLGMAPAKEITPEKTSG